MGRAEGVLLWAAVVLLVAVTTTEGLTVREVSFALPADVEEAVARGSPVESVHALPRGAPAPLPIEQYCPGAAALEVEECSTTEEITLEYENQEWVLTPPFTEEEFNAIFPANITEDAVLRVCNFGNLEITSDLHIGEQGDLTYSLPTLVNDIAPGVTLRVRVDGSFNIDLSADLTVGNATAEIEASFMEDIVKVDSLTGNKVAFEIFDSFNVNTEGPDSNTDPPVSLSLSHGSLLEDLLYVRNDVVSVFPGDTCIFVDMNNVATFAQDERPLNLYLGDNGQLQDETVFIGGDVYLDFNSTFETATDPVVIYIHKNQVASGAAETLRIEEGELVDETFDINGDCHHCQVTIELEDTVNVVAGTLNITRGELMDEIFDSYASVYNSDVRITLENVANAIASEAQLGSGDCSGDEVDPEDLVNDDGTDDVTEFETDEGTEVQTDEGTEVQTDEGTDQDVDTETSDEDPEGSDGSTDDLVEDLVFPAIGRNVNRGFFDEIDTTDDTDDTDLDDEDGGDGGDGGDGDDQDQGSNDDETIDVGGGLLDEVFDVLIDVIDTNVVISLSSVGSLQVSGQAHFVDSELVDEVFDVGGIQDSVVSISLLGVARVNAGYLLLQCSELLDETLDVARDVHGSEVNITLLDTGTAVSDEDIEIYAGELVDEVFDVANVIDSFVTIALSNVANVLDTRDLIIGNRDLEGCNPDFVGNVDVSGNDRGGELMDETFDVESEVKNSIVTLTLSNVGNVDASRDVFITESELVDEIFDVADVESSNVSITVTDTSNVRDTANDVYIGCGELQDEIFDVEAKFSGGFAHIFAQSVGVIEGASFLHIKDGELVDETFDVGEVSGANVQIVLDNVANVILGGGMILGNQEYEDCILDLNTTTSDLGSELLDEVFDVELEVSDSAVYIRVSNAANVNAGGDILIVEGELADEVFDVGAVEGTTVDISINATASIVSTSGDLTIECGELMDETLDVGTTVENSPVRIVLDGVANVDITGLVNISKGELLDEVFDVVGVEGNSVDIWVRNSANILSASSLLLGYVEKDSCQTEDEVEMLEATNSTQGPDLGSELMDETFDVSSSVENCRIGIRLDNCANVAVTGEVRITEGELLDEVLDVSTVEGGDQLLVQVTESANIRAASAVYLRCAELMDEAVDAEKISGTSVAVGIHRSASILLNGDAEAEYEPVTVIHADDVSDAEPGVGADVDVDEFAAGSKIYVYHSELLDEVFDVEKYEREDFGFDENPFPFREADGKARRESVVRRLESMERRRQHPRNDFINPDLVNSTEKWDIRIEVVESGNMDADFIEMTENSQVLDEIVDSDNLVVLAALVSVERSANILARSGLYLRDTRIMDVTVDIEVNLEGSFDPSINPTFFVSIHGSAEIVSYHSDIDTTTIASSALDVEQVEGPVFVEIEMSETGVLACLGDPISDPDDKRPRVRLGGNVIFADHLIDVEEFGDAAFLWGVIANSFNVYADANLIEGPDSFILSFQPNQFTASAGVVIFQLNSGMLYQLICETVIAPYVVDQESLDALDDANNPAERVAMVRSHRLHEASQSFTGRISPMPYQHGVMFMARDIFLPSCPLPGDADDTRDVCTAQSRAILALTPNVLCTYLVGVIEADITRATNIINALNEGSDISNDPSDPIQEEDDPRARSASRTNELNLFHEKSVMRQLSTSPVYVDAATYCNYLEQLYACILCYDAQDGGTVTLLSREASLFFTHKTLFCDASSLQPLPA
eukprot:CAMPEP_0119118424 /NCGR_PEP_ID=MMETSP1310-20130426/308_1 /TAXON_ID=464262 /ORGANISM="Genus nov. species nov., Strain RCC2339" /LENGTH=1739 /DNA_ID=CAMNT_0007107789 /DNA_START=95 /DNA_END=5314 /DNA_ORIENTATION=-